MKRNYLLLLIVVASFFVGCKKSPDESSVVTQKSVFTESDKYTKDILVKDSSGNNQAIYAISGKDSISVNQFIAAHEMSLKIESPVIESKSALKSRPNTIATTIDTTVIPSVWVELISQKLDASVTNFSLCLKTKKSHMKSGWTAGPYIGYSTTGPFLGIVRNEDWYNDQGLTWIGFSYWMSRLEKYTPFVSSHSAGGGWLYPSSLYYANFSLLYVGVWEKMMAVMEDANDYARYGINYKVVYSIDNFRGTSCSMGGYDGMNCQIASPPSGTTAFIYSFGAGQTYFYYTPLPGNRCPVGNGFDGMNCQYTRVPEAYQPFIYNNTFYVRSDLLHPN
jgi:hypothetical protein